MTLFLKAAWVGAGIWLGVGAALAAKVTPGVATIESDVGGPYRIYLSTVHRELNDRRTAVVSSPAYEKTGVNGKMAYVFDCKGHYWNKNDRDDLGAFQPYSLLAAISGVVCTAPLIPWP